MMTELDDAALVLACRAGDNRAWQTLVERYRHLVYSIPVGAYRMQEADAEEVYQQVQVKLFENLPHLRQSESIATWLITVARNECRRFLRQGRRWVPLETLGEPTSEADSAFTTARLQAMEREHRLTLAFARLDDASRRLLTALYLEEPRPSYTELSRRFGRPVNSLGPTRTRCLKKLRELYLELRETSAPGPRRAWADVRHRLGA